MQFQNILLHIDDIIYLSKLLQDFALVKILIANFNIDIAMGIDIDICIIIAIYPKCTEVNYFHHTQAFSSFFYLSLFSVTRSAEVVLLYFHR